MSKEHKRKRGKGETTSGNMTRRVALSVLGLAPLYVKLVGEDVVAEPSAEQIRGFFHGGLGETAPGSQPDATQPRGIVYDLFFKGADADIVPPGNWAHKDADVEFRPGLKTYGHEAQVMRAIRGFFPNSTRWSLRDTCWDVNPNHSLILLGSGVSNLATREFLGDKIEPRWTVTYPEGRVHLAYSMMPAEGQVEREQYGEIYRGPASAIVGRNGRQLARPETEKQELKEDYLLVTRLPGSQGADGTSVVIFAGLHGPGTRSAELIFTSIDAKELSYLGDKIGLSSRGPTPYFQAVFRARSFCSKEGSAVAQELVCMKEKDGCPPVVLQVD